MGFIACCPDVYRVPVSSQAYKLTADMQHMGVMNRQYLEQSHVFILVSHGGYGCVYVYKDYECNKEIEDWYNYPAISDALDWVVGKYYYGNKHGVEHRLDTDE